MERVDKNDQQNLVRDSMKTMKKKVRLNWKIYNNYSIHYLCYYLQRNLYNNNNKQFVRWLINLLN